MSQSDAATPPGMPRWVKILVLIILVLIVLVVGFMLFVGGQHGPGRHAPGMLSGFALLTVCQSSGRPSPEGDTAAGDVIPSEDDH